jgi:hypothetical protein
MNLFIIFAQKGVLMSQGEIKSVIELENSYESLESLDEKDFCLAAGNKKKRGAFLAEQSFGKLAAKKQADCTHKRTSIRESTASSGAIYKKFSKLAHDKQRQAKFLPARELTELETEFVQSIASELPPIIARKKVDKYLGGIVATQTLSNADASGEGPEVAYRIGRSVAYRTIPLLIWIVHHFGVERLKTLDELL